jgi:hypothetical protein
MHWQFNDPESMSVEDIARVCSDVGAELGILIAPAGLAWQHAQKMQPQLKLLSGAARSSIEGGYLTACVLYATIFNKSPVGLKYIPMGGMTSKYAALLQRVAWETVQNYKQPSRPMTKP